MEASGVVVDPGWAVVVIAGVAEVVAGIGLAAVAARLTVAAVVVVAVAVGPISTVAGVAEVVAGIGLAAVAARLAVAAIVAVVGYEGWGCGSFCWGLGCPGFVPCCCRGGSR